MPESLLAILKFCFLALLYLFFLRVVRAVWSEMSPQSVAAVPHAAAQAPSPAAAPAAAPAPKPAKGRGGARGGGGAARLLVVEPAEARGTTYDLADELTVGRASGCQILIDDTFVSQLHARVFRREGNVFVEDLGSTNGTYLNRKKLTGAVAIRQGDRIQVGKTVLELSK